MSDNGERDDVVKESSVENVTEHVPPTHDLVENVLVMDLFE